MKKHDYIEYEEYKGLVHDTEGKDVKWTKDGTWGNSGAGLIIISPDLEEIMLLKRFGKVMEPGTWGIPGGARKETAEGPVDALHTAVVETYEELGSVPKGRIRKEPYVFKKPGTDFTYFTFILEVDLEERKSFKPILNWENDAFGWFRLKDLDHLELHPGVAELLKNYEF